MTTAEELRTGLGIVAERTVAIRGACANKESIKLYLVLPFLGLLGYDYTDPREVYPEHQSTPLEGPTTRCDFAIIRDALPVIAIEAGKPDAAADGLNADLSGLRSYFAATPTVRLAIATDGTVFQFFVDSVTPGSLDDEPFLVVDLESVARKALADNTVDLLHHLCKAHFDPEQIAEHAHIQLVKKRLRTFFVNQANAPTETFTRFALTEIGLADVRASAVDRHYGHLVKTAFEEALVLPVAQQLRAAPSSDKRGAVANLQHIGQHMITTEHEIGTFNYCRHRLAFLVDDETAFDAIKQLGFTDTIGQLTVYYHNESVGRLFDFIEGRDGTHKYIFPQPYGEIVTANRADIDEALLNTFKMRLELFDTRPDAGLKSHLRLA
ncbi:MAG: hypothetical protein AAFR04_06405 [Pseudomonadota bacterium]